jgi:hypothetical protein
VLADEQGRPPPADAEVRDALADALRAR